MSPELIDPGISGLEDICRTKSSDCYALGMIIYEVLSGNMPFHLHKKVVAARKVREGERPERPQGREGELFTEVIWRILGRCWQHDPGDRPTVEDIRRSWVHLPEVSSNWPPLSKILWLWESVRLRMTGDPSLVDSVSFSLLMAEKPLSDFATSPSSGSIPK